MNLRKIAFAIALTAVSASAFATTELQKLHLEFQNAETMTDKQQAFCFKQVPNREEQFVVVPAGEDVLGVSVPEFFCADARKYGAPKIYDRGSMLVIEFENKRDHNVTVLRPTDDGADYTMVYLDGNAISQGNEHIAMRVKLEHRNAFVRSTMKADLK